LAPLTISSPNRKTGVASGGRLCGSLARCKGLDHVDRGFGAFLLIGAAQRLAVNRDHIGCCQSATPPRTRSTAGISRHRGWQKCRRVDRGRACRRETAETAAEERVSFALGTGAYGRNDQGDATADAAVLSKHLGRPVRVQYIRHEGIAWDPKGTAAVNTGRAGVDASGKVIAYEYISKAFSRTDTNTRESRAADVLAGHLLGLPLKPDLSFEIPVASYTFDHARLGWDIIPPLMDRASPLRTTHLRDPFGPPIPVRQRVVHGRGVPGIRYGLGKWEIYRAGRSTVRRRPRSGGGCSFIGRKICGSPSEKYTRSPKTRQGLRPAA
jgi:hypothetical protein